MGPSQCRSCHPSLIDALEKVTVATTEQLVTNNESGRSSLLPAACTGELVNSRYLALPAVP
jgi:hypothetical protein